MERTPYNIALLDIFVQAMGEGFAKNVLCFEGMEDWIRTTSSRKSVR